LLVEAWKITRPVPAGVTVAVSVTEPPNVIVDEESAVVVVVAALFTVKGSDVLPLIEPAYLESPP
jgi:hypothetical protein